MAKFLKGAVAAVLCFGAALWLLKNDAPPARAQGFYAIQSASGFGPSLQVATAPAYFYGATCTTNVATVTMAYCMVFDSATIPSTGAVTPKFCVAIPPGNASGGAAPTADIAAGAGSLPIPFQKGIAVVVSIGADCTTYTAGTATTFLQTNFN